MVTGMPRSATTVVGTILATALRTTYLYEPTNLLSGDRLVRHYFQIPGDDYYNESDFDAFISRMSKLQLRLRQGLWPEEHIVRKTVKLVTGSRSKLSLLRSKLCWQCSTIIWKDPIAAFLATAASERHNIPVLVTYRNPYAIAASFKRLGWGFDLNDILSRARTAGLVPTDAFSGLDLRNSVTNASVLWALVYSHLTAFKPQHRIWHFVDTDKIIADPLTTYQTLFSMLGLSSTPSTIRRLRAIYVNQSAPHNAIPKGHAHTQTRDLSQINRYWQALLTQREIEEITQITAPYKPQIESRLWRETHQA
jgi:hypothetical protein